MIRQSLKTWNGTEWVPTMTLQEIIDQCLEDSNDWFPRTSQDVPFLALCQSGEAGEVANLAKKIARGSHTQDDLYDKLKQEITDVFIYTMNLVGVMGFDLIAEYLKVRTANEQRFGKKAK